MGEISLIGITQKSIEKVYVRFPETHAGKNNWVKNKNNETKVSTPPSIKRVHFPTALTSNRIAGFLNLLD